MTDPIADMLTRIRNAAQVHKTEVVLPYSKIKFKIANLLKQEGYLAEAEHIPAEKAKDGPVKFATIRLKLRYKEDGRSAIGHISRISKPGSRRYVGKKEIPRVQSGFGIAILSTPRGLMTSTAARKIGTGGEVICELY